jgi:tetratricopeptide (TPR) repeat protein
MRMADAAQDFQKAVEADPHSAKAHLSLGAIYLFQYQNGVAEQAVEMDDARSGPRRLTPAEVAAKAEKRRDQIAEQNATNAAMAEEHLKQAVQLDPGCEPAMEYLAALYVWWRDPAGPMSVWGELWARRDDARHWYARLAELNPEHRTEFSAAHAGVTKRATARQNVVRRSGRSARARARSLAPLSRPGGCR